MKHQFALYYDHLQEAAPGSLITIADPDVVHRISTVLRAKPDEEIILFNTEAHVLVLLQDMQKKKITCMVQQFNRNVTPQPEVIALLPLLKREAFEAALYAAVEIGVSTIQPVITKKSAQHMTDKEKERSHRIMVAAAEQSKNFSIPRFHDPIKLDEVSLPSGAAKIFFDPNGNSLLDTLNTLTKKRPETIVAMVGPEGDVTDEEKNQLKEKGFVFCSLTPTILRAYQAFTLGVGALRTLNWN